jgi:phthalate 4,5-dioxygenase oxygenase subunit
MLNRRLLQQAIDDVQAGRTPLGMAQAAIAATRLGPDTVDGIAPAQGWEAWWQQAVRAKREGAPWNASLDSTESAA